VYSQVPYLPEFLIGPCEIWKVQYSLSLGLPQCEALNTRFRSSVRRWFRAGQCSPAENCVVLPQGFKRLVNEDQQNVLQFFEELKNIENRVAWFLAELCKAEKGVQKNTSETSAGQRLATAIWKVQYRLSLGPPKS
jgi:hypothetical protein